MKTARAISMILLILTLSTMADMIIVSRYDSKAILPTTYYLNIIIGNISLYITGSILGTGMVSVAHWIVLMYILSFSLIFLFFTSSILILSAIMVYAD